jgi:hypothetical protein
MEDGMQRLKQRLKDLPDRLRSPLPAGELTRLDTQLRDQFPPVLRAWLATVGPGAKLDFEELGVVSKSAPDWASLSGEWIHGADKLLGTCAWLREQTGIGEAVPIADDGAGNTFYCRRAGDDATIWFHDHERKTVVQVVDSFLTWAHARLDRDVPDESAAHVVLCTWHLAEDPGNVKVLEEAVRPLIDPGVQPEYETHPSFESVGFRMGMNEVAVRRSTFSDGDVSNTVFVAHQTTPVGRALMAKVEALVKKRWKISEVERDEY